MTIPAMIRRIEKQLGFVVVAIRSKSEACRVGEILVYFGQYPLRRGELQVTAKGTRKDWNQQIALMTNGHHPNPPDDYEFFRCRYLSHAEQLRQLLHKTALGLIGINWTGKVKS